MSQRRKPRKYTDEFREEAVALDTYHYENE